MTYDEIIKQVTANKKRYELEMKNRAMFDYNAAQLNAFAFNKPDKMPKAEKMYPFLKSEEDKLPISEQPYDMETDRAIFMQSLLGLQQRLNKNGGGDDDN
ncbi:hypothetical protein [Enterococcus sp. DIV1420a]|uniref:hypothetical protein n=1 Tax=Enterococcus sp. DIV1420a TaxID=2774672 RepID=UPI0036D5D2C0